MITGKALRKQNGFALSNMKIGHKEIAFLAKMLVSKEYQRVAMNYR